MMAAVRCNECGRLTSTFAGACYFCDLPLVPAADFDVLVARLVCFEALAAGFGALTARLTPDSLWAYGAYAAVIAVLFVGLVARPAEAMVRAERRRRRRLPKPLPLAWLMEEQAWVSDNVSSVGA